MGLEEEGARDRTGGGGLLVRQITSLDTNGHGNKLIVEVDQRNFCTQDLCFVFPR